MATIEEKIQAAMIAFEKLPLAQRIKIREQQRQSWVVGETMLEHPEMTREQAVAIYDKVVGREDFDA
jgi:hypothetical protein